MKHIFKISVFNLIILGFGSAHASTIIDSFNDITPQIVTADSTNTVATASAIGGFRTVEITKSGLLGASAAVVGGTYIHSADGLTSAISKITWDANGTGLGAGSGIDLMTADTLGFTGSSCFECFVLDVIDIDQGNVDLTIELFDGSNTAGYTSSGVGNGIHEILFDQFSGLDLTSIMAISLKIDGAVASDMILDFQGFTGSQTVTTVPLPATLWLFFTGLASFWGSHRKKRKFNS